GSTVRVRPCSRKNNSTRAARPARTARQNSDHRRETLKDRCRRAYRLHASHRRLSTPHAVSPRASRDRRPRQYGSATRASPSDRGGPRTQRAKQKTPALWETPPAPPGLARPPPAATDMLSAVVSNTTAADL